MVATYMQKKRQKRRDIDSLIIFYYSKILRKNTKSFLFLPLADMYRRKGMPELSVQICLRGLKVHPNYISARMLLGLSYYDCERLDDAERELRVVADSIADNILARRVLSDIYRKKGKIEDALKEIEAIISIAPDNKNFQQIKEGLQKLLKHYQEASRPAALEAPSPKIKTDSAKADLGKKPVVQIVTIPDKKSSKEIEDFENLLDDEGAFEEIERLFPSKIENLSGTAKSQTGVSGDANINVKMDAVKILNGWLKNIEKR
jgi:tetratricopeptide (TPR) repeat protein